MTTLTTLLAAICGAGAQYFYKHAGQKIGTVPIWKNIDLFLGISLFTLVLILLLAAFKSGGKLIVVYPIYATTYIWMAIIAIYIEKETWNISHILGMILIVLGVSIVATAKA